MTWWRIHVRPRDVFVTFATLVLASLVVIVWTSASSVADQARAGVVASIITTFGTLIGYYLGNRAAESASESADIERERASRLAAELAAARSVVERLESVTSDIIQRDPD